MSNYKKKPKRLEIIYYQTKIINFGNKMNPNLSHGIWPYYTRLSYCLHKTPCTINQIGTIITN